ncbi:hypothetical protein BHE74_00036079 [Ensete ventricosum]|nr:hypothetical protein BHE74_00036079 [Ensete ventricosum]
MRPPSMGGHTIVALQCCYRSRPAVHAQPLCVVAACARQPLCINVATTIVVPSDVVQPLQRLDSLSNQEDTDLRSNFSTISELPKF